MRSALNEAGVDPSEVWAISKNECGGGVASNIESKAIGLVLGDHQPAHTLSIAGQVGNTFSASNSLQISSLLALYEKAPCPSKGYALATAVSSDGNVGCILLGKGDC